MKIKKFLLGFLQTQLLVTIVALPIIVNWGLSLSIMTFVGNLIFAPVLMMVLVVSSLLFFTELLCIPNGVFAKTYNVLIMAWDYVLRLGSKHWLIEYAHPGTLILVSIPISTLLILRHKKINSVLRRTIVMIIMLTCSIVVLSAVKRNTKQSCYQEKFFMKKNKTGMWIFVDTGFFNSKTSPDKVVEFELRSYVAKNFGSCVFEKLELRRPGFRSFVGALAFCKIFDVKKVVFPYFNKELSKRAWRTFFDLKRYLHDNKIELIRV
ncbi:MAG: hypothetical protein V1855_02265 [bacterium]